MKKLLTAALALGMSYFTANAALAQEKLEKPKPASGRIEMLAGHRSATLDTKLSVPIFDGASLFNRNRFTYIPGEGMSSFHVLAANYKLGAGLGVVAELDIFTGVKGEDKSGNPIPSVATDPRAGANYFTKLGPVAVFKQVTYGPKNHDLTSLTNIGYNQGTTGVNPVANVENILIVDFQGENKGSVLNLLRLRAGFEYGGWNIAGALDFTFKGKKGEEVGYNAGAVIAKNF